MRVLQELADLCHGELEDAERYAKLALRYRESDLGLADTFNALAKEELGHYARLHEQAVKHIQQAERSDPPAPAWMREVWDWEDGRQTDQLARARVLVDRYHM